MGEAMRLTMMLEALVLVGVVIAVLQVAGRFRAPGWHIYLVAISYVTLVGWGLIEVYSRRDEPLSWRPFVGIFALTLGLAAMATLLIHYRPAARHRRHSRRSELAAERLKRDAGL
jgi:peptidoglycan biosynthesis protein MviN/MurJ (putative lipid II flippase)